MSSKTAKKPETKSFEKGKKIVKELATSSTVPSKKITFEDFGLVPTKVAKKNESEMFTQLKVFVIQSVNAYLNNEVDKKEKDRLRKILTSLASNKDRLEQIHPARNDSESDSESDSD